MYCSAAMGFRDAAVTEGFATSGPCKLAALLLQDDTGAAGSVVTQVLCLEPTTVPVRVCPLPPPHSQRGRTSARSRRRTVRGAESEVPLGAAWAGEACYEGRGEWRRLLS